VQVERFVQGAVAEVIPRAFWGSTENARLIDSRASLLFLTALPSVRLLTLACADIAAFVRMRRFETTSLHALLQGFSIMACGWLGTSSKKPTAADMDKRKELLSEFLFWLFDGFVVDLIRVRSHACRRTILFADAVRHAHRPIST